MKSYEGGAIPFSAMLGGKNTKKRSKKKVSRTRRRVKKTKTKKISKKPVNNLHKCSCKIINDKSPEGLGFCANCTPHNIIMRGKDGQLWRIEQMLGNKKWFKVK